MPRPIITLLTDFGLQDYYVAAMKGVILGICPEACLVDISHEIEAFNIPLAAWTLSQAWECFPPETVHLVVVDPGVGSSRRPLAARASGHFFVGPDNGVLAPVLDRDPSRQLYEIKASEYFRQPVSDTFHGRDIFAPVAAHLAMGLRISRLGDAATVYERADLGRPFLSEPGCWTGAIVGVDRFGNIVTNLDWPSFQWIGEFPFEMHIGSRIVTAYVRNYSQAAGDEYFVTTGGGGFLEVALNQRDAAREMRVKPGMAVRIAKFVG